MAIIPQSLAEHDYKGQSNFAIKPRSCGTAATRTPTLFVFLLYRKAPTSQVAPANTDQFGALLLIPAAAPKSTTTRLLTA
jgi:hypothetical protein